MNQHTWRDYYRDRPPPSQQQSCERGPAEGAVNAFTAHVSAVPLVEHKNDGTNVLVKRCILCLSFDSARVTSGLVVRSQRAHVGIRPGVGRTEKGLHKNAPSTEAYWSVV